MPRYYTTKENVGKYERVRILRQATRDVISGEISRAEYHQVKTELGGYRRDIPSEKGLEITQQARFEAVQPAKPISEQKVETPTGSFLLQVNRPARDIEGRTKTDFLIEQRRLERERREAEDIGKKSIVYLGEPVKPKAKTVAESIAFRSGMGGAFDFRVRNIPLTERIQFREPVYIGYRAAPEPGAFEKTRREGEKAKEKSKEFYRRGKFSIFENIKGSGLLIRAGAQETLSDPFSVGSVVVIGTGLTLLATKNPVLATRLGYGITGLYGVGIAKGLIKKSTTIEREIGSGLVIAGIGKGASLVTSKIFKPTPIFTKLQTGAVREISRIGVFDTSGKIKAEVLISGKRFKFTGDASQEFFKITKKISRLEGRGQIKNLETGKVIKFETIGKAKTLKGGVDVFSVTKSTGNKFTFDFTQTAPLVEKPFQVFRSLTRSFDVLTEKVKSSKFIKTEKTIIKKVTPFMKALELSQKQNIDVSIQSKEFFRLHGIKGFQAFFQEKKYLSQYNVKKGTKGVIVLNERIFPKKLRDIIFEGKDFKKTFQKIQKGELYVGNKVNLRRFGISIEKFYKIFEKNPEKINKIIYNSRSKFSELEETLSHEMIHKFTPTSVFRFSEFYKPKLEKAINWLTQEPLDESINYILYRTAPQELIAYGLQSKVPWFSFERVLGLKKVKGSKLAFKGLTPSRVSTGTTSELYLKSMDTGRNIFRKLIKSESGGIIGRQQVLSSAEYGVDVKTFKSQFEGKDIFDISQIRAKAKKTLKPAPEKAIIGISGTGQLSVFAKGRQVFKKPLLPTQEAKIKEIIRQTAFKEYEQSQRGKYNVLSVVFRKQKKQSYGLEIKPTQRQPSTLRPMVATIQGQTTQPTFKPIQRQQFSPVLKSEFKPMFKPATRAEFRQSFKPVQRQTSRQTSRQIMGSIIKPPIPQVPKPPKIQLPSYKFKMPTLTPYKNREFKQAKQYFPSLTAFTFKLYGKIDTKKTFSGFEVRPLLRGFKI